MTNDYLQHYKNNNISPVRQDIKDIEKHFYIRKKLYESLGLLNNNFNNKSIIEIGPGGGYNAIYTASLEPYYYQLVEANPTGVKEIKDLFLKYKVNTDNININNIFIEELDTNREFDIAICEGMLPCVENKYQILNKMDNLIKTNGIMLITCSDEISVFFDMLRRLLANILIKRNNITKYEDKIAILVNAFSSHLDTLKGFGRLKEDWCADNLLGNALYNTSLSVSDILEFFQNKYSFYNISPQIIIDATWFKEVPSTIDGFNQNKIDNFKSIWHNLIHYQSFDNSIWNNSDTDLLRNLCKDFIKLCRLCEDDYTNQIQEKILIIFSSIIDIYRKNNSNNIIIESLEEISLFIKDDDISVNSISNNLNKFSSAFGRGQQYITLIKE